MLHTAVQSFLFLATVGNCELSPEAEACVPPLTAKLDAETDEGLKMAINAGLGKYTEGDIEGAKAIVAGMSDGQKERYRDHYLVDECAAFKELFGFA